MSPVVFRAVPEEPSTHAQLAYPHVTRPTLSSASPLRRELEFVATEATIHQELHFISALVVAARASRNHHVAASPATAPRLGSSSSPSPVVLTTSSALDAGSSSTRLSASDRSPSRQVCPEKERMGQESAKSVWREAQGGLRPESEGRHASGASAQDRQGYW